MIPQPYPLFVCAVSPVIKDPNNSQNVRNIIAMLATFTYRVVAWGEEEKEDGKVTLFPLVAVNGRKSSEAVYVSDLAGFNDPCFFGDSKLMAVSCALKAVRGNKGGNHHTEISQALSELP